MMELRALGHGRLKQMCNENIIKLGDWRQLGLSWVVGKNDCDLSGSITTNQLSQIK